MVGTGRAHEDPGLRAEVVRRVELFYVDGPDASQDRPSHVRAASGCLAIGPHLALVQDDASFFAFVDPATGLAHGVPLPAADGVRQFEKQRGNKMSKPDLESILQLGDALLGIPSGSAPGRDRIAVLEPAGPSGHARWFDASALFSALAEQREFAGSELNVEGAVLAGDVVRLFNRGNGASRAALPATDATIDLDRDEVVRYLAGGPAPYLGRVVRWELGLLRGVRLTFTDAAMAPFGLAFAAAAEDSPDAVDDGEVVGVAIGCFDSASVARWTRITERGAAIADKVEGLAFDSDNARRAWAVVDRDDPRAPAALLELSLAGEWGSDRAFLAGRS